MNSLQSTESPAAYWENRAIRYGCVDGGLPAVCSYGMPRLYNALIDVCQRYALRPHLRSWRDLDVLDVGCGVGRWSVPLAARNRVVGIDLSRTMIELAREHAQNAGVAARFEVADVTSFDLGQRFDRVLTVTVLQHVLDGAALDRAVQRLADHLRPGGEAVLIEVAPERETQRCRSSVFEPRPFARYADALQRAGFELERTAGVDLSLLRPMLLPAIGRLPPAVGKKLVAGASLLSLPLDVALARRMPRHCWHRLIVARRM